jgi:hypothetical protein
VVFAPPPGAQAGCSTRSPRSVLRPATIRSRLAPPRIANPNLQMLDSAPQSGEPPFVIFVVRPHDARARPRQRERIDSRGQTEAACSGSGRRLFARRCVVLHEFARRPEDLLRNSMSNEKKFEGQGASNFSATRQPSWVRELSERYASTGTLLPADAARLAATSGTGELSTVAEPTWNRPSK